eukprot:CAMPEP_0206050846 /NCGR_PEP_ID=MMETSP1466-20131121/30137_1 /ASSEMBLY_ACC=CAM_ASM_001126 /TAXON_ID=44452 /ORGANISM="Pavlova gyrans, Strain CCMP608" /LENGTH=132 /DNA_ID=CAMNT_0053425963 /DNA_START=1 /DNA_END=395 /DNA_ORIENTATION=+
MAARMACWTFAAVALSSAEAATDAEVTVTHTCDAATGACAPAGVAPFAAVPRGWLDVHGGDELGDRPFVEMWEPHRAMGDVAAQQIASLAKGTPVRQVESFPGPAVSDFAWARALVRRAKAEVVEEGSQEPG